MLISSDGKLCEPVKIYVGGRLIGDGLLNLTPVLILPIISRSEDEKTED